MIENIKVICCDIDGTLVKDEDHLPTKFTNQTITELRNKGYLFGLASGRPVDDILDTYLKFEQDKQFDFLIGYNGAELYDDKTKIKHQYNPLTKQNLKEIVLFMQQFDVNTHMYRPGYYLSSNYTDKAWFSAFKSKREFKVVELETFYQNDNPGIMFRTQAEKMPEIEKALETFCKGKDYIPIKTQPTLMEFSNKDSSKGFALEKYCQLNNISIDQTIAFGDTTNDNEMIKKAHYGICMINGSDDTKALADIITPIDNNHDGAAIFMRENLL